MSATEGLQDLFTDAVVAVETRAPEADDSLLWPEERAAIGEVVPGRWWDWVMGRRCARHALVALGLDAQPVLRGERREPLWPQGVVGAITHTSGYAAAAVARTSDVISVGADAEPDAPLPAGVLQRVARAEELAWATSGADPGVVHPDRLLFSAKEAIYKAWYPVARSWLGFEDARVEIDPSSRTFHAEVLVAGPISHLDGRYASVEGVLLTAIEAHRG